MRRRTIAGLALTATLGAAIALAMTERGARAQRFDPRRPPTWVVGAPRGPAPMHRVDGRRSGLAKDPLPTGTLRVAWRKTTSLTLDQPALAGPDNTLAIVSNRGDVTFLDEAGEERATVRLNSQSAGQAVMTSDGTVTFMNNSGEIAGIRRDRPIPRFSRIGGERNPKVAPLALDDGGIALATMTDLLVLDSEGNIRARASLPERAAGPLLSSGDKIIAVTEAGAVFGWTPGREPVRLGSFGGPVDLGAALRPGGTLLAVVDGSQLAEIDLAHGALSTRATAPQGLYLGPPAVRDVAGGSLATLLARTQSREFVVTVDAAGQELIRAPIASFTPIVLSDGGAPPLTAPPHVGPLVDARGTVAFATTDGHIGVVSPEGAVDILGEPLCSKGSSSGVKGLTPFGKGAFAVTCEGGVVLAITGTAGGSAPPAAPPLP